MPLRGWNAWRAERQLRRRARRFVQELAKEPAEVDVSWLVTNGTGGDIDHARWELRYARRALGLITAQRDALDDRTASAVARELSHLISSDPNVAAGKRAVAERQFNVRLAAYTEALASRGGVGATGERLGQALMDFAGASVTQDAVGHAGELLIATLVEVNDALRREFGAAALPETVPPSAVRVD